MQRKKKYKEVKIHNSLLVTGFMNITSKPSKAQKHAEIKCYSTLVLPTLFYLEVEQHKQRTQLKLQLPK